MVEVLAIEDLEVHPAPGRRPELAIERILEGERLFALLGVGRQQRAGALRIGVRDDRGRVRDHGLAVNQRGHRPLRTGAQRRGVVEHREVRASETAPRLFGYFSPRLVSASRHEDLQNVPKQDATEANSDSDAATYWSVR